MQQPLRNEELIKDRHDIVQCFIDASTDRADLYEDHMKRIPDILVWLYFRKKNFNKTFKNKSNNFLLLPQDAEQKTAAKASNIARHLSSKFIIILLCVDCILSQQIVVHTVQIALIRTLEYNKSYQFIKLIES